MATPVAGMIKTVALFVGIVLVIALALFAYRKYGEWQNGKLIQWRADSARVADSTRVAVLRARKADTIYLQARGGYVVQRARVLNSPTATAKDTAIFAACDLVVRTCDERHAADTIVIASLRRELETARARPTERPPRLQAWGEGLYDVLHMTPVFRAGAELRLVGPIEAVGAADLSIPPVGQSRVTMRGLVGIRYRF